VDPDITMEPHAVRRSLMGALSGSRPGDLQIMSRLILAPLGRQRK
jgi:hypothetical protein